MVNANQEADPDFGITLEYGDRTVFFPILEAGIWHNQQGTLCIEIEADWGDIDMDSLDGAYGPPMINAGWDEEKATPVETLSGTTIHIPKSFDEKLQDHVSTFYLSEHLDLDDLKLRFGLFVDGKMPVEFSGIVQEDPTGSDPDKGIKVLGNAIVIWSE